MINVLWLFVIYCGCGALFNGKKITKSDVPWQKAIGESFFIGVFFIVIINNLLQLLNSAINPVYISSCVACMAIFSLLYRIYHNKNQVRTLVMASKSIRPSILLVLTLIVVSFHFYYILIQNQSLPLTPWDAWNGWIAKAKIWYYHGINEMMLNRADWLVTAENFTNPTAHYPDALPLLYVFNSGFFGWNETALNAIYPAMYVAFLLAFYGHVKQLTDDKFALVAVGLLASVPFINIHFVLSGYADIWVAAFLVLVILNTQHFLSRPALWCGVKVLIFLATLVMFKLEAWVWLSIYILTFVLCLLKPSKRKWFYFAMLITSAIWYLMGGINFTTPFGELIIAPGLIEIPALGRYVLAYVNTTSAWLEALFFSKNWNLLWYSLPLVVFGYCRIRDKSLVVLPALYLLLSLFFIYVLFYMTYASIFANDFTSSNRIVLHIVPLYLYFLIQVAYQFHRQSQKNDFNESHLLNR